MNHFLTDSVGPFRLRITVANQGNATAKWVVDLILSISSWGHFVYNFRFQGESEDEPKARETLTDSLSLRD